MVKFATAILALFLCAPSVRIDIKWNSGGLFKSDNRSFLNTSLRILDRRAFKDFRQLSSGPKAKFSIAEYHGRRTRTVVIKTALEGYEHQLNGSSDVMGDIQVFDRLQCHYGPNAEHWPAGVVECLGLLPSNSGFQVVMEYVHGATLETDELTPVLKDGVKWAIDKGKFDEYVHGANPETDQLPPELRDALKEALKWADHGHSFDQGIVKDPAILTGYIKLTEVFIGRLIRLAEETADDLRGAEIKGHDSSPKNFIAPADPQELFERGIVWINVGGYDPRAATNVYSSVVNMLSLEYNLRVIATSLDSAKDRLEGQLALDMKSARAAKQKSDRWSVFRLSWR